MQGFIGKHKGNKPLGTMSPDGKIIIKWFLKK
jgi:hypothetical protein